MTDIYFGLAIIAFLSLAIVLLTVRWTKPMSKRAVTLTGVLAALLLVGYVRYLWNSAVLSSVLPVSSVVVLSNWFPLAAAFLGGITWTHGYGTKKRRVIFGLSLYVISFFSTVEPLLGRPPECLNRWQVHRDFEFPMCRQTSGYSCTAAAAATLLRMNGISAEESEMARLCLTRKGTTWQGLYRGLSIKTEGKPFKVKIIECTIAQLKDRIDGPAILSVGIDPNKHFSREYVSEWGWQPGMRHSVVLVDFEKDTLTSKVADPAVGFETWTVRDMRTLWQGRAVVLVPTNN